MINTKELEKRWYKYKAKHVVLVLFLLFLLLALPYGLYYIFEHVTGTSTAPLAQQKETPKPMSELHTQGSIDPSENNQTEKLKSLPKEEKESDEVMLSPTIPIVDLEREKRKDKTAEKQRYVAQKKREHKAQQSQKLVKAKASVALTPQELAVIQGKDFPREKKTISFQTSNAGYIDVMKQKFAQNKNPREALLLAKAFYKSGEYAQAEEWALRANSLDKDLAESWFVFAKAKAKMGKHQEALKVLSSYYKSSKSPKAKELITKIKTRSI